MLLTGFPVGGIGETDGPAGAMAVGQTLKALGWDVVTVACETTFPVVDTLLADLGPVSCGADHRARRAGGLRGVAP